MFVKQLIVGSMEVCCYLAGCEKTRKCAVIDPGGDEKRILAAAKEAGMTIEYIIATHGHPDHVCGNRLIKEATGAAIIMHEADAVFFARPEVTRFFSMLGLEPSPPADIQVLGGDIISIGAEKLQVLHTPGHTPGGICLYNAPHLFTGDTLFAGGLGRTDFPGGSSQQLLDSIASQLLTLPDETIVWPGHGYGGHQSTIGAERRSNPYLH